MKVQAFALQTFADAFMNCTVKVDLKLVNVRTKIFVNITQKRFKKNFYCTKYCLFFCRFY